MYLIQNLRRNPRIGLYKGISLLLCLVMLFSSFRFGGSAIIAKAEDSNTVTVTVNYVYDSNKSMVAQPYRAQIAKDSDFNKTLEIPKLFNYSIPADKAEGLNTGITLNTGDEYTLVFDLENVSEDIKVTLYYVAGTAKYTVYHYYQNLDDDDYSKPTVIELTGDIDAYTQAVANNKPGYHCKGIPQTTIAADGTTEVEIYYDRNYYTVIFDVNGGVNGPEPIYAKYGTTFNIDNIAEPTRKGYTFLGWGMPAPSGDIPITENKTYTAVWQPDKGQSDYTIVIWGQNPNDDEYSYLGSYEAWGNVGSQVTWNEGTLISHVHTDECRSRCDLEEHTHTEVCLICGEEEHTHNVTCYPGGTATVASPVFPPSNPSNGTVYKRLWESDIYYNGTWYEYTGNLSNGEIAIMNCGKTVHSHTDSCYGCGKTEHTHSAVCSTLICGVSDTPEKHMSDIKPDSALWVFNHSDTVTVDANGSTVLNVYFNRKEFTLSFRKSNSSQNDYGTIEARWGKNIADEYNAIVKKAGSSFWSENRNADNGPYTNYIGVMPKEDKIYYNYIPTGTKKNTMTYYGEDLNGEYKKIFDISFNGDFYVSDEDHYEFQGFTYDHGTKNGDSCQNAAFYYKRNTYNLDFYSASNNTTDKSEKVKYQKPLGEYDYTPTDKPDSVEKDAVFVGWYQNPECTGEQFDLSTHTMPANNIALYAKWVNGLYRVRTYTDDTITTLYTYNGYSGVQENIVKYTLADEPTSPTKDGFVFIGWFYKDGETEKPFSFAMPITKDYDLYPKFSEPQLVEYTVHYYKAGTEEKIADDRVNSVMIGNTVTEKAKIGNELNLLPEADRNNYYPTNTSTSVIINRLSQEIIFYYTEATEVKYTVYYQDAEGNNLIDPATKTTGFSIVTEEYVAIPNYSPRQYQITQDMSSDETKNKIIFIYDPMYTSLKILKNVEQAVDNNQTFLFRITGDGVDLTVSVHGSGSVTVSGLKPGKDYTVTEITDWAWRYGFESVSTELEHTNVSNGVKVTLKTAQSDNQITFNNTRVKNQWLDGNSYIVNNFN